MQFGIKTLDDIEVKGKTILLRVDINQPVDKDTGVLRDITRIKASVRTIAELSEKGAKTVILAHQGSDIDYDNFYSTQPHSEILSQLLSKPVGFIDDVTGPAARAAIKELKDGDIVLLDNVRFLSEEQSLFENKLKLSQSDLSNAQIVKKLAPLADYFVCDAFAASHRSQPSLCGFAEVLPSAMGRLFEEEYCVINSLMESPKRPCVFILGGAKVGDAFVMMNTVLKSGIADKILAGGLAGQVLLEAKGISIGEQSLGFIKKRGYMEFIEKSKKTLEEFGDKIEIPEDVAWDDGARVECDVDALPTQNSIMDIGQKTAKRYAEIVTNAKTVFVNGPLGVFEVETTELGTRIVGEAIADTEAYTVLGGGDSIAASNKYGYTDKISYICTGGGALIRFLSGEELPVIAALRRSAKKF